MIITEKTKRAILFKPHDAKRVGDGCYYLDHIVWLNGEHIEMGDGVGFNYGCYVNGYGGLVVGDGTLFGPYSMIHTANHRTDDVDRPIVEQGWVESPPVQIGPQCWIGMGVCILPGVSHRRGLHRRRGERRHQRPRRLRGGSGQPRQAGEEPALTRVLFLQQQPCIRSLKYGLGLRDLGGFELGFACQGQTLTEWYGEGDELFDRWWHIDGDPSDVARVVEEFRPDVIHCHNLPDRLTVVALDVVARDVVGRRVPVVHDVHDLQSLRHTPYEDGFPEPADPLVLEKQAVTGCAALVAVSQEMLDEIIARHGRPRCRSASPTTPSDGTCRAELPPPERPPSSPPRIVYQGTCPATAATTTCGTSSVRSSTRARRSTSTRPGPCPTTSSWPARRPG